jgi:AraC-like DNA-binding protein
MYLEGKVLELVSLAIAEELEIHQEKKRQLSIKHETLDRIYEAEQLLLKNLDRPPSLSELAQQVQLNEFTLKQGFKTVFNCTIFDYLRDRRLEQAKQLLETGQMTVAEVMKVVGYCDRHHFAAAFRRKFEVNPRDYRKKYKF